MSRTSISWLPALFHNAGGYPIVVGVSTRAEWFLEDRQAPLQLVESTVLPFLLPLLAPDYGGAYSAAYALVASRLIQGGHPTDPAATFPFTQPVFFAFQHHMNDWCALSLPWLPFVSISDALKECLT